MAAKSKLGRTRDVKPVSFRLTGPERHALEGMAGAAGLTANEQARAFTVAALGGNHRVTPSERGDGHGVTPVRDLTVEYDEPKGVA